MWAAAVALALIAAVVPASATEIRSDQAFAAATHWGRLAQRPMGKDIGRAGRVSTVSDEAGNALFHVVDLVPAGYVVMAADDEVEPVIAFSDDGGFVAEAGHPLYELLRRDLGYRIRQTRSLARAVEPSSGQRARHREKWEMLLAGTASAAAVGAERPVAARGLAQANELRVDPLVQSRWGQTTVTVNGVARAVYNYYTPPYAAGDPRNYPSGCPATAIGQIMRYHQWPQAGVGVRSVEINVDGVWQPRALRGGDGQGGPYDWASMVLVPDAATTEAQRAAIGALLHDIGVALPTTYTARESGAMTAFPEGFQYGRVATIMMNETDRARQWEHVLMAVRANLDAALPVLFSIDGDVGGHSVVCDGYGYNFSTLYHHLNMGWNGADNAWYNLPAIDSAGAAFETILACHFHISPNAVNAIISGRITDDDGAPLAGAKVVISGDSSYVATTNARGIFAVPGVAAGKWWTIKPEAAGYAFTPVQGVVETSSLVWTSSTSVFGGTADRVADFSAYREGTTARKTPVITWASPAASFAGTALTAAQLNATADVPGTFTYTPAEGYVFATPGTYLLTVTFAPTDAALYRAASAQVSLEVVNAMPTVSLRSDDRRIAVGGSLSLSAVLTGGQNPGCQWQRDGRDIAGATSSTLTIAPVQPVDAGVYSLTVTWGDADHRQSFASARVIVGVSTATKVAGAGQELVPTDIVHPNGKVFDQVLLTGAAEVITADAGQVTRTSFIDPDDDIVQVEFSGPGTLALVLDDAGAAARPVNYNQACDYVKGLARIVISGADENTNVSVFSVGRKTAVNPSLFRDGVTYGGIADIASIAISSPNGKFGGVRTANTHYFAYRGMTGLYAPGVTFTGPVYIGNLVGHGSASPVILLGAAVDRTLITGGDLQQAESWAVQVSGLTRLEFVEGEDSHGTRLPAKTNRAVLFQVDSSGFRIVTDDVVLNPAPSS